MSDILKFFPIREEDLDQRAYFSSLLESSARVGLISEKGIMAIRSGLWELLREQAKKRCGGKSSSLPKELAEELLESIAFVIGVKLKAFLTLDEAVSALMAVSVKELFDDGMEIVRMKMANSKRLQNKILKNLFNTPNVYYKATVADGINGFFKLYKPQFEAQNIHITADYPIFLERPELDGVEFIERYLRYIDAENAFLTLFDPLSVHRLMCAVKSDYADIPINFFEPVFMTAAGCVILGKNPSELSLSPTEAERLGKMFCGAAREEIDSVLNEVLARLANCMKIPPHSENYARLSVTKLSAWIEKCTELQMKDGIFTAVDF